MNEPGSDSPALEKRIRRWFWFRELYRQWLEPRFTTHLARQRLKLVWYVWQYWPILFISRIRFDRRLRLLYRFLTIDWNVPLGHTPDEIVAITDALSSRPARANEIVVEAGCWQGGSSAKFSILCKLLGYRLNIYDSFEGVENIGAEEGAHDFSGEYASPEAVLNRHLEDYGESDVCTTTKGWFSETIASSFDAGPVRMAYIDCDIAKGTLEVLDGVVPTLVEDGVVFTQDFHIKPVRKVIEDPATWSRYDKGVAEVRQEGRCLASIRFPRA